MANFLTVPAEGSSLSRYLEEIRRFPMLKPEEEYVLAKNWQEHGDVEAAHRLVTSHLRLVAKIAMGYRGYGLPLNEIISEGNVGLMQAVKKFDPDKGFRLATYAMWWIRASIQEYILRSWSLVKMGTTAAQKKLFFNLRRLKGEMAALEEGDLRPEHVKTIAHKLAVTEDEVVSMNRRLSGGGDASLNAPIGGAGGDGESEWMDWLADDQTEGTQETRLADSEEFSERMTLLQEAMADLNERERHIIQERRLKDEPMPASELRRAKDHLKGSLMLNLESTSSRMSHLARQEIYFDRHFGLDETLEGVERVSIAEVQRVARDLFSDGALAATVLGAVNGLEIPRERLSLGA